MGRSLASLGSAQLTRSRAAARAAGGGGKKTAHGLAGPVERDRGWRGRRSPTGTASSQRAAISRSPPSAKRPPSQQDRAVSAGSVSRPPDGL